MADSGGMRQHSFRMHCVYILHWNRPEQCLTTVRRFREQGIPLSITVIDNGSAPELVEQLRDGLPAGVALVAHSRNLGWGAGFNPAIKAWLSAKPDGYAFLSAHDALPEPSCLKMLIQVLDQHPDIGLVSPEYGLPDLPHFRPLRGARLVRGEPRLPGVVERFPFVHGTLMGVRPECLAEIGCFDERFFAYGDEIEISLRANRLRWSTAVVWGAIVINPGTASPTALVAYLWTRNMLLVARIYGGRTTALARATVVLATTSWFLVKRRAQGSLSSPFARFRGVIDYLRGRFGAPTPDLVTKLKSF